MAYLYVLCLNMGREKAHPPGCRCGANSPVVITRPLRAKGKGSELGMLSCFGILKSAAARTISGHLHRTASLNSLEES